MFGKMIIIIFFVVMGATGCAALADFVDTITSGGGASTLNQGAKTVAPFLGPYGDIVILAGWLLQNGWLGFRKFKNGKANPATRS